MRGFGHFVRSCRPFQGLANRKVGTCAGWFATTGCSRPSADRFDCLFGRILLSPGRNSRPWPRYPAPACRFESITPRSGAQPRPLGYRRRCLENSKPPPYALVSPYAQTVLGDARPSTPDALSAAPDQPATFKRNPCRAVSDAHRRPGTLMRLLHTPRHSRWLRRVVPCPTPVSGCATAKHPAPTPGPCLATARRSPGDHAPFGPDGDALSPDHRALRPDACSPADPHAVAFASDVRPPSTQAERWGAEGLAHMTKHTE